MAVYDVNLFNRPSLIIKTEVQSVSKTFVDWFSFQQVIYMTTLREQC